MQEHVELEVSLEVIMAEIAKKMFELSDENNNSKKEIIKEKLDILIYLQESAYKGNRESIKKILKREFV